MTAPPTSHAVGVDTDLAAVMLRPVRGANAFESTVEQLATAIRLGAFAVGDRLPPERELAAAMKVSRATLREAIAALRQVGLVSTRSGRGGGTEVIHPSQLHDTRSQRAAARDLVETDLDHYRDSLVARRIVEPGAAFAAASVPLAPAQRELLATALRDVSGEKGTGTYRQADSRFHLAIATVTGSPRIIELVTDVQRDLHHMLSAIPVLAVNIAHSNDEHTRITDAILAGDAPEARAVMEVHCDSSAALLRGLLGMLDTPARDGAPS